MSAGLAEIPDWPRALRWYLGVSVAGHLVWEVLQLPLYTLWSTGTFGQKAFAVVHCTLGDAMIAGLAMLIALAVFGRATWPADGAPRVFLASLALGAGYTIYSEWLNVSVRGSWAYSASMPVVPFIGTGLTPLLQWIVIPAVAQWIAFGYVPWRNRTADAARR